MGDGLHQGEARVDGHDSGEDRGRRVELRVGVHRGGRGEDLAHQEGVLA